ncbi:MAG: response regulator transcription factor [Gemmatimonadetes bacterium]|nr:response regulator transcription factor [Gemmatimonadota bacterium]
MARVLIVEDDDSMAVALKDGFTFEGYEVNLARDGEEGLRLARGETWDLVVLDVMLPRMSGYDVCKELRSTGSVLPILMLTARGQEIDKVLGLKLGADDYVTKPFSFLELLARAEALLRRVNGHGNGAGDVRFGKCTLHLSKNTAARDGEEMGLSAREYGLLKYLAEHPGQVITRDQLLDAVWGYETAPVTRTVDMHVAKLRKKIEDNPADPRHILTVHGVGYKFVV